MATAKQRFQALMDGEIQDSIKKKKQLGRLEAWGIGQQKIKKSGAWSSNLGESSYVSRLCSKELARVCACVFVCVRGWASVSELCGSRVSP